MRARAGALHTLLLAFAALAGACGPSQAPEPEARPLPHAAAPARPVERKFPLQPGISAPRRLAAGEVHVYEIDLAEDSYLHLSFEQRGVDLVAAVFAPGRRLFVVDSLNRDQGPEEVRLVAGPRGRYRFEVVAGPGAAPGEYQVHLREPRPPGDLERSLAGADRAFHEARGIEGDPARRWEAEAKLERAIRLYGEAGDVWHQACAVIRLADLYGATSRRREALGLYSRGQRLFEQAGDLHLSIVSFNEMGTYAVALSDFEGAADWFRLALGLARKRGEIHQQAAALHNLGTLLQLQGRPWAALASFREALGLWQVQEGSGPRGHEAETLTGIGWVYATTGDWRRAADAHGRALHIRNRLGDRRSQSVSLTQIGAVWLLADPGQALPYFEKALELQKEFGGAAEKAATLNGLGLSLRSLGRYGEAAAAFRKALGLQQGLPDPGGESITWTNLGWTWLAQTRPGEALKSFEQGVGLARQTRNPMAEARALQGMAAAELARGNLTLAQRRGEEALGIVESLRAAVLRPDLQASYLAANESAYSLLIRILMARHRREPGGGFDLQALSRSEQARSRVLLDSIRESRETVAGVPAELLERRRFLLAEVGAQDERRRRTDTTPSEAAGFERALAESLDRLSEVETEVRQAHREDRGAGPPSFAVKGLQRLLDRDTLFLEYHLGTPHSDLWVVSADGVQSFELPGTEALDPLLRSAWERLAGREAPGEAASGSPLLALSRHLLGPVASQLAGKRLVVAADGALQYIPLAALPHPTRGGEPLVLHNEIVSMPSLAVLAELRHRKRERPPAPRSLATLADAVFDASDERLWGARPEGGDVLWQPEFLPRLRQTRKEAEAITSLLPEGQAFTALDFEASRELVMSGRLSGFSILHIATHGLQRMDPPELSALALSRFDSKGIPQDGYLRVTDIMGLGLSADLVVLSACETALGREVRGEGLAGLPQAFLGAGAQRVLVSLWQVEDESTAELMTQFYRRLLVERFPPGKALREAQLAVRAQPRWSSPRYWAGFVLQGDWR